MSIKMPLTMANCIIGFEFVRGDREYVIAKSEDSKGKFYCTRLVERRGNSLFDIWEAIYDDGLWGLYTSSVGLKYFTLEEISEIFKNPNSLDK
jgi:hypothetical protein